MAQGKSRKPGNLVEDGVLFEKFAELYVEYRGNGHKAALAAGYSPAYAKSYSWKLVARLKLKVGPVLRRVGLDEMRLARELEKQFKAKVPKWNPETKVWDTFADSGARQHGIDTLADLLDARPPRKLAGDTPDGAIPIRVVSSIPKRGEGARVQ